ncbi:hypothetical protein LC55x_5109 [Lysobacter capsici]|nr:hypothetical protein LC55x_5109 [Lysobacter capsici]
MAWAATCCGDRGVGRYRVPGVPGKCALVVSRCGMEIWGARMAGAGFESGERGAGH